MAAGASSPELFSSIVSLFITHSSLGLGTIVGSEIFNQLIICAGAVYASKNGVLALDKAIVTREVGFYALGIALLYFALKDSEVDPDDPDGPEHIYVSFLDAVLLFGGYLLYVAVCANMEWVVGWFGGGEKSEDSDLPAIKSLGGEGYGAIVQSAEPFQGIDGVTIMVCEQEMCINNFHPLLLTSSYMCVKNHRVDFGRVFGIFPRWCVGSNCL
jgi:hypothetical protein